LRSGDIPSEKSTGKKRIGKIAREKRALAPAYARSYNPRGAI
jgi:hypothetical protein